jgi:hypothetical protein
VLRQVYRQRIVQVLRQVSTALIGQ